MAKIANGAFLSAAAETMTLAMRQPCPTQLLRADEIIHQRLA